MLIQKVIQDYITEKHPNCVESWTHNDKYFAMIALSIVLPSGIEALLHVWEDVVNVSTYRTDADKIPQMIFETDIEIANPELFNLLDECLE